jgi:hypothetical protein
MQSFRILALALVAWFGLAAGLATGAFAQNGLERFEKDIKPQFELEKFTYESGQAVGSSGFVLNKVVAVVPANAATGDKASTVKIDKVTVEDIDFDRLKKSSDDDIPRFAKLKLEGMTGDDEMFTSLTPYGIPNVPVDIVFDYRLDAASKVLTLNKLEIGLRGQAKIAVELVMDGISDKASQMENAKDDGRLRTASVTFDDQGLISKLLPALAKENGDKPENLVAIALMGIAGFSEGQGPATLKVLDTVASFVSDWKSPKGPLTLGVKPAKSASLSDLDKVMQPNALVEVFGLNAAYSGTRDGAAKAAMGGK